MAQDPKAPRVPAPYDYLIGSPVYSPSMGRGWLGYDESRVLSFVTQDLASASVVAYDRILRYDDRRHNQLWLIFCENQRITEFLLHPPEDLVVFPFPTRIRNVLEAPWKKAKRMKRKSKSP